MRVGQLCDCRRNSAWAAVLGNPSRTQPLRMQSISFNLCPTIAHSSSSLTHSGGMPSVTLPVSCCCFRTRAAMSTCTRPYRRAMALLCVVLPAPQAPTMQMRCERRGALACGRTQRHDLKVSITVSNAPSSLDTSTCLTTFLKNSAREITCLWYCCSRALTMSSASSAPRPWVAALAARLARMAPSPVCSRITLSTAKPVSRSVSACACTLVRG
mmetsp:Transcript_44290/g.134234  ORF Transcript_44290/g.134234 Transcript_44290/m.134234 type:complete len:214 (+) Transcript_44290:353-994(+)